MLLTLVLFSITLSISSVVISKYVPAFEELENAEDYLMLAVMSLLFAIMLFILGLLFVTFPLEFIVLVSILSVPMVTVYLINKFKRRNK